MTAAALQDRSQDLLSTLAVSLLSSFSPYEVVSASAQDVCSKALLVLSTLSGEGFIEGSRSLSQSIASVISSYTVTAPATSRSLNTSSSLYPVSSAVSINYLSYQINFAYHNNDMSVRRISFANTTILFLRNFDELLEPISASSSFSIILKIQICYNSNNLMKITGERTDFWHRNGHGGR